MWTLLNYLWTRKHDNIRQKQQQKLATSVGRERTNPIHRLHDQNCSPVSGFDVVADQCVINKGHLLSEQGCTVGWRDVKSSPMCSPSCFFYGAARFEFVQSSWRRAGALQLLLILLHIGVYLFSVSPTMTSTRNRSWRRRCSYWTVCVRSYWQSSRRPRLLHPSQPWKKKKKHTLQICRQRSYLGHSHLWRKDPLGCSPRMAAWRISRACVTRVTVQRCQSVCVCVFLCIIPRVLQWITSVVHLKRSW